MMALAASPTKRSRRASPGSCSPSLAASPLKKATPSRRQQRGRAASRSRTPSVSSVTSSSCVTPARRALTLLQLASPHASPQMGRARRVLSTALPEDGVVGRQKELAVMRTFLEGCWKRKGKRRRALYVSGAPGTGKTACLKHLLRELGLDQTIKVIFLNCMGLKSSTEIFERVAVELDGNYDGRTPKKFVEAKICAKGGKDVLLVLDEVDQLSSRDQEILYSVFEWPQLRSSRLSLIGIANALDLTDRILPRLKLSESVSPQELSFPAYTRQEIVDILTARLKSCTANSKGDEEDVPVLKPAAIRFLAAKIAAISGDMRKALDVCRRAIELAEIEHGKQAVLTPIKDNNNSPVNAPSQVDIPQVSAIFNQIYSSRVSSSLNSGAGTPSKSKRSLNFGPAGDEKSTSENVDPAASAVEEESADALPLQQKLLLACLFLICSADGKRKNKEVLLGKLQETYSRVCKKRHMAGVDLSEVHSLCSLLESRGFFALKNSNKGVRSAKVSLRIDEKEVEEALQDKALLTEISKDASCIAK